MLAILVGYLLLHLWEGGGDEERREREKLLCVNFKDSNRRFFAPLFLYDSSSSSSSSSSSFSSSSSPDVPGRRKKSRGASIAHSRKMQSEKESLNKKCVALQLQFLVGRRERGGGGKEVVIFQP